MQENRPSSIFQKDLFLSVRELLLPLLIIKKCKSRLLQQKQFSVDERCSHQLLFLALIPAALICVTGARHSALPSIGANSWPFCWRLQAPCLLMGPHHCSNTLRIDSFIFHHHMHLKKLQLTRPTCCILVARHRYEPTWEQVPLPVSPSTKAQL